MAKIFSVREFALNPGVKPEDFEQAIRLELAKAPDLPGWKASLGKGDRGSQVGNYLFMWELESVERRNEVVPVPNQPTEEGRRYLEATATLWQTFKEMATPAWHVFTDYVVTATS